VCTRVGCWIGLIWVLVMYVAIEGTVGAGKSTVMRLLQKQAAPFFRQAIFAFEPVTEFQKLGNVDPLALSYQQPEDFALAAHLHIMSVLGKFYEEQSERADCVHALFTERSFLSVDIFSRVRHMVKHINDIEALACLELAKQVFRRCRVPDVIIFLSPSFQHCENRVMERSRDGETEGDPSFFSLLYAEYERVATERVKSHPANTFLVPQDICNSCPEALVDYIKNILTFFLLSDDGMNGDGTYKRQRRQSV